MKILKYLGILLIIGLMIVGGIIWYLQKSFEPKTSSHAPLAIQYSAKRLTIRPIIETAMHPILKAEAQKFRYNNVNGPSIIKVPEWIENPLGKYYLYFAHHKGAFLRMAYAEEVVGPWNIYDGPILPLAQSGMAQTPSEKASTLRELRKYLHWSEIAALSKIGKAAKKAYETRTKLKMKSSPPTTPHVASPDVIIDHEKHQIRMYYHGLVEGTLQMSKVALSSNGIDFTAQDGLIGAPYLRVFEYRDYYYGFAMPGFMYRSEDGIDNWELRNRWFFDTDTRHSGVHVVGNMLYVFYSRVGDSPERILYTTVDMKSDDWNDWTIGESYELLQPELGWEGGNTKIVPSIRGEMGAKVNQLRDPDIFQDDGKLYLLYTGGGEQNIGIARLNRKNS